MVQITSSLVQRVIGVPREVIRLLRVEEPTRVISPTNASFTVTPIDANHCPGAVMLLFELDDGRRFLHTGDVRFHPRLCHSPALRRCQEQPGVESLFLDTTYARSRHRFEPQEDVIASVVQLVRTALDEDGDLQLECAEAGADADDSSCEIVEEVGDLAPSSSVTLPCRTLFLFCTYLVGKERILLEVLRKTRLPGVYVEKRKQDIVGCLGLASSDREKFQSPDTDAGKAALPAHVVPMGMLGSIWPLFRPQYGNMIDYLHEINSHLPLGQQYRRVIGFVPTGWVHSMKIRKFQEGPATLHLVPYSEHSSFEELRELVRFVRPKRLQPIVYADETDRLRILRLFSDLLDRTGAKRSFLRLFDKDAPTGTPSPDRSPARIRARQRSESCDGISPQAKRPRPSLPRPGKGKNTNISADKQPTLFHFFGDA